MTRINKLERERLGTIKEIKQQLPDILEHYGVAITDENPQILSGVKIGVTGRRIPWDELNRDALHRINVALRTELDIRAGRPIFGVHQTRILEFGNDGVVIGRLMACTIGLDTEGNPLSGPGYVTRTF